MKRISSAMIPEEGRFCKHFRGIAERGDVANCSLSMTDASTKTHVIASQCAHWRGNLLQVSINLKGIATSALWGLLAMTSIFGKINYNLL